MRAVAVERPVTIDSVRYGERWFPFFFRLAGGQLLLSIEYGHDANFAPFFQRLSADNGRTWGEPSDHVPRLAWAHSFADGELYEIDSYGIHDPATESDAVYFGARSFPDRLGDTTRLERIRVHCPSAKRVPLTELRSCFPTVHWWPLWNSLHGRDDLRGDEIHIGGPYLTDGIELTDGRLLAVGYFEHADPAVGKTCTWLYESADRGRTWREKSLITDPAPGATLTNEATLVQLKDGRLYAAMRTEGALAHAWSDDEGVSWTKPVPMRLIDEAHVPCHVWPMAKAMADGTLVMVYGRPGKHLIVDPTGTGEQWQGRLDIHQWELDSQAMRGVPPELRLRGVGPDITVALNRHTDSSDYLGLVVDGPRRLLVVYDVQHYIEHWNAQPVSAVRLLPVELVD